MLSLTVFFLGGLFLFCQFIDNLSYVINKGKIQRQGKVVKLAHL